MEFLKELIIIVIFCIGLYKIMQFGDNKIQDMKTRRGKDVSEKKRGSVSSKKKTI